MNNLTKVVNVKVKFIRPEYQNLGEWMDDPNNVYIGRRGIVFIDGERFPKKDSIWANPFKVKDYDDVEKCCRMYEEYVSKKLNSDKNLVKELLKLEGKNLGCWCKEKGTYPARVCHGDVLVKLIQKYSE